MPYPHHTWTDTYLKKKCSTFCILCINYSIQGVFFITQVWFLPSINLSNRKYPSEPGSSKTQTMNSYWFPGFIKDSFNFTSYLLIYQIQLIFHFFYSIQLFFLVPNLTYYLVTFVITQNLMLSLQSLFFILSSP